MLGAPDVVMLHVPVCGGCGRRRAAPAKSQAEQGTENGLYIHLHISSHSRLTGCTHNVTQSEPGVFVNN